MKIEEAGLPKVCILEMVMQACTGYLRCFRIAYGREKESNYWQEKDQDDGLRRIAPLTPHNLRKLFLSSRESFAFMQVRAYYDNVNLVFLEEFYKFPYCFLLVLFGTSFGLLRQLQNKSKRRPKAVPKKD